MNKTHFSTKINEKTKKSTRISDDFDTDFELKTLESTRVSQILRRMRSSDDIDLIFKNDNRKRCMKFLGTITLCALLIFAYNYDPVQLYRDSMDARLENFVSLTTEIFYRVSSEISRFNSSK
ncbi:MAG: hypothetical protein AB8G05_10685 [Oligoflexales bacterium]